LVIFAADIGSVSRGNFGWSRQGHAKGTTFAGDSDTPDSLVAAVGAELNAGNPVALGFESPQWVDVREDSKALTKARDGDGNRPWSAGAGCGALATGLVQTAWILRGIKRRASGIEPFLDWDLFVAAGAGLFLWEAFVTGNAKSGTHQDDARVAVEAFEAALPNPVIATAVHPGQDSETLSLLGAAIIWSGLSSDVELLRAASLVIKGATPSLDSATR
jgi:hypothetical protein